MNPPSINQKKANLFSLLKNRGENEKPPTRNYSHKTGPRKEKEKKKGKVFFITLTKSCTNKKMTKKISLFQQEKK